MSIFERWRKKKQPQQETKVAQVVESERPQDHTIIDVGWDVVYAMESDQVKRKKLYNSLEREKRILLGQGSLFVSKAELDYFLKVMGELKARPVVLFDFEKTERPSDDLLIVIEEYKNKQKAPIVFVKNYFQDLADRLDPQSNFDNWLRGMVQNGGWAAVIHGDRHAPGLSGNIAGSSKNTEFLAAETRRTK